MIYPFDDNEMKYIKSKRQYVVTKDAVLNNLFLEEQIEEELKNSKKLNSFLMECSDDIYNMIYTYTLNSQKPVREWQLAKDKNYREVIKRALLAQVRYALRSAGSAIKDQHGIDFERLRSFDKGITRGFMHIAPEAERILENEGLLYVGKLYINPKDLNDGTY